MQDQAAPPRFRGDYPHILTINKNHLPRDKFMQAEFTKRFEKGVLVDISDCYQGSFPKLKLKIQDPELRMLAGPGFKDFDAIDCKDVSCTCIDKPRFLQLFSCTEAERDALVYNNCKRTLFAAAKRQIKSAPVPDIDVLHEFVDFAKTQIDRLIGDDLANFGYSYNQWFNHLTRPKQKRMEAVHEYLYGNDQLVDHYSSVENMNPKMLHYEAICKVEIQALDGKPRMVCSIPDLIKYVMGPVCWKLEELFAQKIPTYCGGQNLQQMQDKINHMIDDGFCIVAEGDGSAFDNTQDVLLKEIDRYIYRKIIDRIHHVPKELFDTVANAVYKIMDVPLNQNGKKQNIMTYAVLGTVFSGDCDTTLMNTLRMGLYNWFTNYKAGLKLGTDYQCFSKGDDFSVIYNQLVDLDHVKSTYDAYWLKKPKITGPIYEGIDDRIYGLGQILKFIEFGPPNSFKFCSLRSWYTDPFSQHIYLTRDPSKFTTLSKYSRKALHMSNKELVNYLLDQALAIKVSSAGLHYFDDMAKAYEDAAAYYMSDTRSIGCSRSRKIRDRRLTLPLEVSEVYNGYSYEPRQDYVEIEGSYWETMKKLERANPTKLSSAQLDYVNQQIDSEFLDRPIWLLKA
jgi:hypothetical protein